MNIIHTFPIAARALMRNKLRAFLTTLGIMFGVAAVISMVTAGDGAKSRVEAVFSSMGTNLLIVLSGSTTTGGVMGGFGSMPTLTWNDLRAIRREAPAVAAAAPAIMIKATIMSDDANWTTSITGTTPEFFPIRSWLIERGGLFGDMDLEAGAKVIVVGGTVSDHLFGSGVDPIGRTVRIGTIPFQVVGLLQRKGQSPMGTDYDDATFVPASTFQTKLQGGLKDRIAGAIVVSATTPADTTRAQKEISALLRDRHHLGPHDEDDFNIRNLTEIAAAQEQSTRTLTFLLAAIAIVSLMVGGIGIMNIMLVSVTERTREIGVRMAVGAKPWHILMQFLVEATSLSMMGGLIGVTAGMICARLLASHFRWPFETRVDMILVSFLFSAAVGIGFGLYPAWKASQLDPIDALRYE